MPSRVKYLIGNFEEMLIAVLLPLMVVTIFVGTFGRYSGWFLLPWAEELARYLMIWVVFLGIGTGAKRNAHFVVEILQLILPKSVHKYLRIFTTLFVTFFMGVLIVCAYQLISRVYNMGQISPSMHIPMWTIYIAIPVGCFLMAVRTIQYCVKELLNTEPHHGEDKLQGETAGELPELYE